MKKVLLAAFIVLALSSCRKNRLEGGSGSLPANTNFNPMNVRAKAQVVKMIVTANVLNMIYNEDVTLIMDVATESAASAVHLKEDFTGTQLARYDYHSQTRNGVYALNYVDDNLNNIAIYSTKDTVIAGRPFVKKRITRSFIYQLNYNSSADATVVMNQLLKQTDLISFSAWFAQSSDGAAPIANTTKLTYVRL